MIITFVRHGETEKWEKGFCQSSNEPLSEKGEKHSKQIAKLLKNKHFDITYVSTMKRAKQTADYILSFHPKIKRIDEPLIREHENGSWAGKTKEWRQKQREKIAAKKNIQTWQVKTPKGESQEDVQKRAVKFIKKLIKKDYKSVLIISHASPIIYMRLYLSKDDVNNWKKYYLKPSGFFILKNN